MGRKARGSRQRVARDGAHSDVLTALVPPKPMPRGKGGVRPLRPSWGTVVKFQSHAVFGVSVTQSWGTSMASSPSLLGSGGRVSNL